VVRTTSSWVSSFGTVATLTGLTPASRVWVPGPLEATMNLFAAVHAAWLGAVLVDDAGAATHAQLTPTALARCLDDGVPLGGMTLTVAGDRLSPVLHDRAVAAGAVVHHYYGAAELSFVAWGGHAEALHPFPGVQVAVRAREIWVRTPYLCTAYDGPPGPLRTDADGWATVGDRGTLAGDGPDGPRLVVSGRPDAVTVGGATVVVAEVEARLRDGAVQGEVCVVGVPDTRLGSLLAVVLSEAADLEPVRRRARESLAGAARPRLWFHLADLPRTPAGKVDRKAVVTAVCDPDGAVGRLV
jgi:acyl-CoA synthetase (AMP-forming)/AMP-acid ligase II